MRYNELLIESAARELAEKLPTLHKHDYNSIDRLMQHVSAKHKITSKKLHDLFVHKYGHTPDVWVKKLKNKLGEESVIGDKVFHSMGSQLLAIGKDADKIKKHSPEDIKNAIVKKLHDIDDPKLNVVTKRFLQKAVEFNRSNPKTMAAIFGFTFSVIARVSMQVSHNFGLSPTQATLILEATLPTLGNFLGYLVNGFSVKDSIQSGLIAGAIGVGGTMAASGVLNELEKSEEQVNEISDETLGNYLSKAGKQVDNRLNRISQARERLNKGYEIYRAEDPRHPIEHFTANTPEEARKYYHNYIDKYESDVDFDLRLRKSTGLGESALKESVDSSDDVQKIKDFIKWSIKQLHIQKPYPKITLSRNTKVAQQGHHTGVHTEDNKIWVYIKNRNLIDIFRTIFHELVHERQSQLNMIKDGDSYPGSPIEAMADLLAGKYIKIYGKQHPEIFQ